ncbi:MAG: hypothetical protein H6747_09435 [Deltaproteobacteria bacterium]|nr:hypothetical protein [Deltaproteobacteria bacterium]
MPTLLLRRGLLLAVVGSLAFAACSDDPTGPDAAAAVDAGADTATAADTAVADADAAGRGAADGAADAANPGPDVLQFSDVPCEGPTPSAAALVKAGKDTASTPWPAGSRVLPGGRMVTPAGTQTAMVGFPIAAKALPDGVHVAVLNTGTAVRAIQVLRLDDASIAAEVELEDAFAGLAVDGKSGIIWAAGGDADRVEAWQLAESVTETGVKVLQPVMQIPVGGYPAGLSLSADGGELRVGSYYGEKVVYLDTAKGSVSGETKLGHRAYGLLELPADANGQGAELVVAGFGTRSLSRIDLASRKVTAALEVGSNPQGMAVSSDGSRLWVALSDEHVVVTLDRATGKELARTLIGEPGLGLTAGLGGAVGPGAKGSLAADAILPGSSPSTLLLDEARGELLVVRAADNAIDIRDPDTLARKGAIPTGWYPTDVVLADGGKTLVVAEGKGIGAGPVYETSGKKAMKGAVTIVDRAGLDLAAATAAADTNLRRPESLLPFDCKGVFPVPTAPGGPTPIKRIVLIVRENKTYDSVLGDLEGADGDKEIVEFGPTITPNLHALAKAYTAHDNFYADSENSHQGHLWLTSSFVNDYVERTWTEGSRNGSAIKTDPVMDRAQPDFGTFFTLLIRSGIDFRIFGEVVGTSGKEKGPDGVQQTVMSHVDAEFPGIFYNTEIPDVDKAEHVVKRLIDEDDWPPFVYILLPCDHTYGTKKGKKTPESMVHDNDVATGRIVDAISHSKYWNETAVFITQDDSQSGSDHVDYHRSLLVVASPWAKRGHISHVHTSFPSLFRTFELIFGLPPMSRFDALAAPLFDAFTMQPEPKPYAYAPRTLPVRFNGGKADWMSRLSAWMDFSGPDRNPDLGALLHYYRLGRVLEGSRIAPMIRGEKPWTPPPGRRDLADFDDDDAEEADAHDAAMAYARAYFREHPEKRACWSRKVPGCAWKRGR